MGTDQNEGQGKKKGGRGSVNNEGRLKRLMGDRAGSGGGAGWDACDPRWMQAVVVAVNRLGGAVSFGLSRDGGAHSLIILLDGDRETLWFNGDADLDAELEKVFHLFETA